MAIKTFFPTMKIVGEKIAPEEIDRYEVYSIGMAGTASTWWASAGTAGTAASVACVIINALPDYPRNIRFALAGSATGMAGTLVVNGKDQFGNVIQESIGFGSADNGGTQLGTKVFAQFSSGTLNYGTAVGNGTPAIGFVAAGTTCLFGLPVKLNGTTDVVHMSLVAGTGAVSINGGTIASYVNVPMSAVLAPKDITGTQVLNVWIKPSYDDELYPGGTYMNNLSQVV